MKFLSIFFFRITILTEYAETKINRNDDKTTVSSQRSAIEGISSAPRIGITVY